MNLIIDELPRALKLKGSVFPIRTDFRIGMLFEMMIESRELSDREMARQAFRLWFEEEQIAAIARQDVVREALDGIIWFYSCGKRDEEKEKQGEKKPGEFGRRIYDFEIDAPLIYAAFRSQYGIDLQEAQLHWWQFTALFSGLHQDEQIMQIMGYRSVNLAEIKNKDERRRLAKLQARYALPDHRTKEEKQRLAGALFGGIR